jgi:hypothetical protein
MAKTTEAQAAAILAAERKPDRAEKAAIDCVKEHLWVLWHADDYATGVVRLLSRAGLLRDRAREDEVKETGIVMRRLEDEANAKLKREHSAALAEITRLREVVGGTHSPAAARSTVSTFPDVSEEPGEAQEGSDG